MLDPSIPLMAKGIDSLQMLDDGSKLAQLWQTQKTDAEMNRLYKESSGDLDKMLEIGKQSPFARYVMPQLQAQKQAQIDAVIKQQKDFAEIGKTDSEAFKNNQQGGGFKLENSQKQLGAIQSAVQQAAMTGDKGAAIIGLDAAKRVGLINEDDYQQQYQLLSVMTPEQVKVYAQSVTFANAKDPASLIFTTADNVLDNQTSVNNNIRDNTTSTDNNIRSTNVQKYGIDKTAETADENRAVQMQRLEFDQQQAEIKNGQGEIKEANGKLWIVYKDGTARPAVDANGTQLASSKGGGSMTEQQSKDALFGARIQEANKILSALEAKDIKAPVMNSLPFGDKFSNALPSILGGASAEQQQYVQAQRDFINAILRKESGAVIADSEFANAQKQYFPQIGDSSAVIAQKAKNRELAMKMIVGGAGNQGREQISKATSGVPYANAGERPALSSFFK